MPKKNYQKLKIDNFNFLNEILDKINKITNIVEIMHDYCAYNFGNDISGSIMGLAEILKEKSNNLANRVDTKCIEIINNNW